MKKEDACKCTCYDCWKKRYTAHSSIPWWWHLRTPREEKRNRKNE